MALSGSTASPLFLREDEIRRGIELLYFGYSNMTRSIDDDLSKQGLGRAHHRALYFIARQPDLMINELLALLAITKQSLGRVLNDLIDRGLVETRQGKQDRRQTGSCSVRVAAREDGIRLCPGRPRLGERFLAGTGRTDPGAGPPYGRCVAR